MSTGMVGADPRALREMAGRFDAGAQELMGVRGSVQVWVDMTNIWLGLNYHLFKDMWETTGARTIVDAASILHRCADVLRANADAQDGTSAVDGGATGGAGGGSRSGLFGGSAAGSDPSGVGDIIVGAATGVVGHELAPSVTVGDLTGLLGAAGLKTGPGIALDIALAVPALVETYRDPSTSLGEKILATEMVGVDITSGGLMSIGVKTRNPAVFLAGTAMMTWGTVFEEASKMDLSPDGFSSTIDFASKNTHVIGEEVLKATGSVFTDWGKKTLTSVVGGVLG